MKCACLQDSPKLSIDLVCTMEEIEDISPVLADTMMDAGYHAIDVLFSKVSCICFGNVFHEGNLFFLFLCVQRQYSRDQFEKLAKHESERVGRLLGRILAKQYPNADDIQAVSFNDLLEWNMWPIFITIFGMIKFGAIILILTNMLLEFTQS